MKELDQELEELTLTMGIELRAVVIKELKKLTMTCWHIGKSTNRFKQLESYFGDGMYSYPPKFIFY